MNNLEDLKKFKEIITEKEKKIEKQIRLIIEFIKSLGKNEKNIRKI